MILEGQMGSSTKKICPFCNVMVELPLARHIKAEHGEETLRRQTSVQLKNYEPLVSSLSFALMGLVYANPDH